MEMAYRRAAAGAMIVVLVGFAAAAQYAYDQDRAKNPASVPPALPAWLIRVFNLGLDSATAGFLWTNQVMTELPFLKYGFARYSSDLALVNQLDPHLSIPYYWSVLILPDTRFPERIDEAITIGERGIAQADPDWRLAFYLAMDEALYKEDYAKAAMYFDMAARSAGIPPTQKSFSENYGLIPKTRDAARQMWALLYQTAGDETTKERALLHIKRFDDLDALEYAAQLYKRKYGSFPKIVQDMVTGGILRAVPQDPFGFAFIIDRNGFVGVKTD